MSIVNRSGAVRHALSSLRVRVVGAILLAVLPLALISSQLAVQSFRASNALAERRVDTMLAASLARIDTLVRAIGRDAAAAADAASGPTADCPGALRRFGATAALRVGAIRIHRPDGTLLCEAGDDNPVSADVMPQGPWRATVAPARRARSGALVLPVAAHGTTEGGGAAFLVVADLLLPEGEDAVAAAGEPAGSAWLLPAGGTALLRVSGSLAPPDHATLRALLRGDPFASELGPHGTRRDFAVGRLPDGSALVVGDGETRHEAAASLLLFRRICAIAALLAIGVLLVAIGAHVTVTRPIRELTERVTRWRAGDPFERSRDPFQPRELVELAGAFRHAADGIAEREVALERARTEQELLIKEIHHRVKNNLQIVASLLNLQASRIRVPEARAEFQSARDRVRALATLHRHLYADGGLHSIAMRPFLLELSLQLLEAIGEREGQRIRLEVEAPELQMSSDQAVPLALVVTEAVSNAIKYAFPGGRSGQVRVELTELGDDMLQLVVQDNGVGLPAGRAETESGIRDGLGLQLIRGFARQLGATLSITEDGGTRYELRLKLHRLHEDFSTAVA